MADQTRLPPEVDRWVGALTHEARKAWHNAHRPEILFGLIRTASIMTGPVF
jgi:hypothetical protein